MYSLNEFVVRTSVALTGVALSFSVIAAPQEYKVPHNAKLIPNVKTLDVFKDGVYHFYEKNESFFKAGKRQGSTYRLGTSFSQGMPKQFSYGGNRDWVVVNGHVQKPSAVQRLRVLKNNRVSVEGHARDALVVSLQAYDVSGKPIQSFLTGHNSRPTKTAENISTGYRFSKGSVAYVPTFQTVTDKVVIPNKDVLTGQKNIESFLKRFSGKIPNCLSYEKRSGYQPYAIRFINRKGNNGEIEIFHAKRSSVFCEAVGKRVALGKFQIKTVNGTRVMALTFPDKIDSRDVGIKASEREALRYAFVEVTSPRRQVLPGLLIDRNKDFHDFQYRFNAQAAADIKKAMD